MVLNILDHTHHMLSMQTLSNFSNSAKTSCKDTMHSNLCRENTVRHTFDLLKRYEVSYNYLQPKEAFTIQIFAGKENKH